LIYLGRCYMELNRAAEAREALDEAIQRDPKNQQALIVSAQLAMQQGEAEEAERIVRQALAIDANESEANFILTQCLRQIGRTKEAEQQAARYKRIQADWNTIHDLTTQKIPRAPHDVELQYQLGVILLRLGEDQTALNWLKKTLETDPKHDAARKALAE